MELSTKKSNKKKHPLFESTAVTARTATARKSVTGEVLAVENKPGRCQARNTKDSSQNAKKGGEG